MSEVVQALKEEGMPELDQLHLEDDYILLDEVGELQAVTSAGIVLGAPPRNHLGHVSARVAKTGKGLRFIDSKDNSDHRWAMRCKEGDVVVVAQNCLTDFRFGRKMYRLVRDANIIAVVEDQSEQESSEE